MLSILTAKEKKLLGSHMCFGYLYTLDSYSCSFSQWDLPVLGGAQRLSYNADDEHLVVESVSSSVLRIKGSAIHLHHSFLCKELNLFLVICLYISFLQTQNQNRNSPGRLHLPVSISFIQYYSLSLAVCNWIIMTPLKQWFLPPATSWQL